VLHAERAALLSGDGRRRDGGNPVTLRSTKAALAILALAAAGGFAACGNKNPAPYAPLPGSGSGGSSGSGGGFTQITGGAGHITASGSAGATNVDAGPPSGTISIVIQSPMGGAQLSGNLAADVSAKITVMGGTDIVDPATVRVSLVPAGANNVVSSAPLIGPMGSDNTYAGKLSLAGLPTGMYTLTVTASSSTNLPGSASEMITIDAGPKITVLSPIPGHHYKGSLIVEVSIDPGMFAPASMIAAAIAGTPITLQPAGPPNVFRAAFDLTMPIALDGDQLFEVSAQDSKKTVTDIKFVFNVDTTGPTITGVLPVPGAVVGNIIKIAATIADPAGLDTSSIQVLVGDKTNPQFRLPLTPDASGAFSTLFDTHLLTQCKLLPATTICIVRPTLSFRASDQLGNETTVSYTIGVDNLPPIADLQPPRIRSSKIDKGLLRCSFDYDPLSEGVYAGDAPKDGCMVPQMFDLRARVEDTGNPATGEKQEPISGIDPDVTAAYILADTSQPLVVDTDGDGNCDVINPKLVPTTTPLTGPKQVLKVRLRPVPPAGAANFLPDLVTFPFNQTSMTFTVPGYLQDYCEGPGADTDLPLDICKVENPTVAISYANSLSAIWAAEPISPDDMRYCFGSQLDTNANNIPQSTGTDGSGWRCIAIATADLNGNVSTSMPIRVWVDYTYAGADQRQYCLPPPATAGPMPSCTGTYDKVSDTLSPKACKARSFKVPVGKQEVCYQNDCSFCAEFPAQCL
jgi:hypothetical protein